MTLPIQSAPMTRMITVCEDEWDKLEAVYEAALKIEEMRPYFAKINLLNALDAVQPGLNSETVIVR